MAGPWFTVIESNATWQTADTILISDGKQHVRGSVEIKVELVAPSTMSDVIALTESAKHFAIESEITNTN